MNTLAWIVAVIAITIALALFLVVLLDDTDTLDEEEPINADQAYALMMEAARSLKSLGGVTVEQFMANVEAYSPECRKALVGKYQRRLDAFRHACETYDAFAK